MSFGSKKLNVKHTLYASYIGYIVQAISINFAPLLFLTFQREYGITLEMVTLLVSINFVIQFLIDGLSTVFIDKIGFRAAAVAAHLMAAFGLSALAWLPAAMAPNSYAGLVIATIFYAIGGGLTEVVISPIVEAAPTERKASAMSLLHSFYSWGQALVVIGSVVFFKLAGIENWRILAVIWSLIPLFNALYFMLVPIYELGGDEKPAGIRKLFGMRYFWIMLILMFGSGAAEQAISQWASAFAEASLGVSKAVGDIAGPCAFAILMGSSRVFYAKLGAKIKLSRFMAVSAVICLIGYVMAALSPVPAVGLLSCAVCGLAVGIMWPGTYNLAAGGIRNGGAGMFAILALAGDAGCTLGPTAVGVVSGIFGDDIKKGLLAATVFPMAIIIGLIMYGRYRRKQNKG